MPLKIQPSGELCIIRHATSGEWKLKGRREKWGCGGRCTSRSLSKFLGANVYVRQCPLWHTSLFIWWTVHVRCLWKEGNGNKWAQEVYWHRDWINLQVRLVWQCQNKLCRKHQYTNKSASMGSSASRYLNFRCDLAIVECFVFNQSSEKVVHR